MNKFATLKKIDGRWQATITFPHSTEFYVMTFDTYDLAIDYLLMVSQDTQYEMRNDG